eukprot:TRINITY_DN1246_c1_g1_i5.p1 TRINITY_DN1246_c1_g1~~TRINITY_DN1246_c1_g1_i5.p1  ORF type:complete len:326 (+),score=84.84 TRINITY_DN1246_c1_g1_i5:69-980(+)
MTQSEESYDAVLAALGEQPARSNATRATRRRPPYQRGSMRDGPPDVPTAPAGHREPISDAAARAHGDEDRGRPDPYLTLYRQAPLSRVSERNNTHDRSCPREPGGWLVEQLRTQRRDEARLSPMPRSIPAEVLSAISRAEVITPQPRKLVYRVDSDSASTSPTNSSASGVSDVQPSSRAAKRPVPRPRADAPSQQRESSVPPPPRVAVPVRRQTVRIKQRVTADALFELPFEAALDKFPGLRERIEGLSDGQRALWKIRWPERHRQLREILECWLPEIAPQERASVRSRNYDDLFQEGVFLFR